MVSGFPEVAGESQALAVYRSGRGGQRLPPKLDLFGVGVSATDSYDEVVSQVIAAAHDRRPLTVSALSVHALMMAATEPQMRRSLVSADIVTTDGQPVRWAMNALHGAGLRERVCGPELMLRVCEAAAREGVPIYLYGSLPKVLRPLVANLRARWPSLRIVGAHPSRMRERSFPPSVDEDFDRDDVERIKMSGARLVFIGLGCPLQEMWAVAQRERLGMPALCVGAAFDFHAGLKQRAPAFMQRLGLEWAYRLAQDPRRLIGRYAKYNSQFLLHLARALFAPRAMQPLLPSAR